MKKPNLKRFLVIPLILFCCLLAFAACDGNTVDNTPKVETIAIDSNAKPQSVYPEGQELDLSKGSLKVTMTSGAKETVPLNAEGVTVTGYDKTQLGDQSLVISYGGKSITYTVTVEKRMSFSGYETNYFVGDSLNLKKGKVTIVKDDGTRASIRLDDAAISVVDFDSTTAAKGKAVTIRYNADGIDCSGTIAVNVYEFGNVKFVKPTKSAYGSHDSELNLQGGYFTITAKDNESLTKQVPLDQSMVSGFDSSVVTKENVNDPIRQTITVSYANQTFQFEVSLIYSGVSIMWDVIEQVKHVDVDAEELQITAEEATLAIEGMQAYLGLAPTDRDVLNQADVEKIARMVGYCATSYGNYIASYLNSAIIVSGNQIGFAEGISYESTTEAAMILSDPECPLVSYSKFVASFLELFGELELRDEVTIGQYVKYIPAENWANVASILNAIVQVYDDLAVVPNDWTVESLADYGDAVDSAVMHLANFPGGNGGTICKFVSAWREKNDYLDIIYTYYYHYLRSMMMEETWGRIPLPAALEEIYVYLYYAASFDQTLKNQGNQALWQDTSYMHLYRYKAIELSEKLLNGDNQLYIDLYNFIDFERLIRETTEYSSTGVVNLLSAGYGDEELTALMDTYIALLAKAMDNGGTLNFEENKDQFQAILDGFAAMTPSKQNCFLSALFYNYGIEKVRDSMVMTFPTENENRLLVFLLEGYLSHNLSEEMMPVVQDLFLAMEHYLNKDRYDEAMNNFVAKMDAVRAAYEGFSTSDKALFNQYLGNVYTKYTLLYDLHKNGFTVDETLYVNQFSALVQAIREYQTLRDVMVDPETSLVREGMLGMVISAYTRVEEMVQQILAIDNEQVPVIYSTLKMAIYDNASEMNLEYAYMNTRYNFLVMMHGISYTSTTEDGVESKVFAWELYQDTNVEAVMNNAYYVMMNHYYGNEMDGETVLAIMRQFRQFMNEDIDSVYMFRVLGGNEKYYAGLQAFFDSALSNTNRTVAAKLLEVEKALCQFAFTGGKNEEDKAAFMTAMEELIALRETVTDTANFDTYLAEMYNYYLETYNRMKAEA